MNKNFYYCTKCGTAKDIYSDNEKICFLCGNKKFSLVPEKYISYIADVVPMVNKELEGEFIEEVIKKSPEFDPEIFKRLPEIQAERDSDYKKTLPQTSSLKCPYCNSTSVRKIGTMERSFSAGLFGLGSSKIGKQYHCNCCGANF